MKARLLETGIAGTLIVILAGIFVHAPLSVWLGSLFPDISLAFKVWKEVLLAVALLGMILLVTIRHSWHLFLKDWLLIAIAAYAGLHIVMALFIPNQPLAVAAGIAIDLRYLLYFCLISMLLRQNPRWSSLFVKVAVIGGIIVVGFAVLQLFLPKDILTHIGYGPETIAPYMTVDDDASFVRVNSTLRGPNPLGAFSVIAVALIAAYVYGEKVWKKRGKTRILLGITFVLSGVSLWISYSRSAWVAALIAVILALVALRKAHVAISAKKLAIGACAVLLVGAGVLALRQSSFVATVIFHDNQTTGGEVTSNEQHLQSWQQGAMRVAENPWGEGTGSAGSASLYSDTPTVVESQYLFVAHETGVAGLMVFLAINGAVLWLLWRRRSQWLAAGLFASGVGLLFIGLLLPVWADDTVSLVWWGLAAVALQMKGGKRGRTKNK